MILFCNYIELAALYYLSPPITFIQLISGFLSFLFSFKKRLIHLQTSRSFLSLRFLHLFHHPLSKVFFSFWSISHSVANLLIYPKTVEQMSSNITLTQEEELRNSILNDFTHFSTLYNIRSVTLYIRHIKFREND